MKAVILAAGKGIRMLPLTEHIPKALVEVNGKPFLYYVLKHLHQAGYNDIGIVVGYKKEKVAEFLKKNKITATLIEQKEHRGTGHALMQAHQFCGNENFVMLGGDNLFSVKDLRTVQKKDDFCYVAGKEVTEWKKYGVLVVQGEKLVKIVEKPVEFVSNIINTQLYKFTPDIWKALEKITFSVRNEYELPDAITILAQQGQVKVLTLKGYWLDLGCKEDIPRIERFLSQNEDL